MKKTLIGILVCSLLILTILPNISSIYIKKVNVNDFQEYEFIPGEFIVKFKEKTKILTHSIKRLNEKYQVKSIEKIFKNSENTILDNIYLYSVSEDSDILSIVNNYLACPNIAYVEPNYIIKPNVNPKTKNNRPIFNSFSQIDTFPNDPDFDKQWSLHNIGQLGGKLDSDIDALEAWKIQKGDENIIIAIIDTGIDYNHPDLVENIWMNTDEIPDNGIDDDSNGFIDDIMGWDFAYKNSDPKDTIGHGTLCAGVAGAVTNDTIGIAGVSWNCKIMNVKMFYDNYTASVLDAAMAVKYAADNGANVISMSWGDYTHYQVLEDACNYSYEKGALLIAAVGNDNANIENDYPPAYENVIAVASTNNKDKRGSWSNYGSIVDIAAPGDFIYSTMPTYEVLFNSYGFDRNYEYASGTSLAAPCVAGVAGLVLSKDGTLSQEEVTSIILDNVDAYNSEKYIGNGRINAYKAITEFYSNLDIKITGGLGVETTITYNGLGESIGEPYEITIRGGLCGLINETISGTIDFKAREAETISSGLLFGLGVIEISVKVGIKEQNAKGLQLFIFSIVK